MNTILPIDRLRVTDKLIAFHHPEPSHPFHIIILPKKPIARLMDLTASDSDLVLELVQMVQSLVEEFKMEDMGYRLIVNGGKYQSLPQLHFHLVSGDENR